MGRSMPFAGALFLVGGLALSGIPPTNGFISKMLLFDSGIDAGQWWPLAILGVASILTLVYTTRAFMRIWWQITRIRRTRRRLNSLLARPHPGSHPAHPTRADSRHLGGTVDCRHPGHRRLARRPHTLHQRRAGRMNPCYLYLITSLTVVLSPSHLEL